MVSCDTGLEVGDMCMRGLVKDLFSAEALPDHLSTDLPGWDIAGSEAGCIAHHLIWDLSGLTN